MKGQRSLYADVMCTGIYVLFLNLQMMDIWFTSRVTCLVEISTSTPSTCRWVLVVNFYLVFTQTDFHRCEAAVYWPKPTPSVYSATCLVNISKLTFFCFEKKFS